MRYLLGQRNQALVTALVGGGATRPSSSAIEGLLGDVATLAIFN